MLKKKLIEIDTELDKEVKLLKKQEGYTESGMINAALRKGLNYFKAKNIKFKQDGSGLDWDEETERDVRETMELMRKLFIRP